MTMITPRRSILDRFLKVIGKDRAVHMGVAKNAEEKFGPYQTTRLPKESFFRALLRPRKAQLPEGWAYLDNLSFSSSLDVDDEGNGKNK